MLFLPNFQRNSRELQSDDEHHKPQRQDAQGKKNVTYYFFLFHHTIYSDFSDFLTFFCRKGAAGTKRRGGVGNHKFPKKYTWESVRLSKKAMINTSKFYLYFSSHLQAIAFFFPGQYVYTNYAVFILLCLLAIEKGEDDAYYQKVFFKADSFGKHVMSAHGLPVRTCSCD
ncbi:MAG TPA: hypothetical protein PKN92_09570 [Candidatus Hydrogenedentes bacterium]|nr:hypothetical protein [Candidatus Hydrogenedentota bacterium]HPX87611.1 hypothetical protein [Candidatus Hydrogenedentota bacterium]